MNLMHLPGLVQMVVDKLFLPEYNERASSMFVVSFMRPQPSFYKGMSIFEGRDPELVICPGESWDIIHFLQFRT